MSTFTLNPSRWKVYLLPPVIFSIQGLTTSFITSMYTSLFTFSLCLKKCLKLYDVNLTFNDAQDHHRGAWFFLLSIKAASEGFLLIHL
uniref:Uncharacterized protein n=1 Tax=Lepeophtheirus salmonis TaxID=72036 RepID=A0A0K2TZB8_LEPSM